MRDLSPLAQRAELAAYPGFLLAKIGVMQLHSDHLKAVVFLGTKKKGKFLPRATGFLVTARHEDLVFIYVATAEHVVTGISGKGEKIFVRYNTKDGGAEDYEAPLETWTFHPDESSRTDVAVAFFEGNMPTADLKGFATEGKQANFVTRAMLDDNLIGPGHDIAIVGLFRSHYGQDHNIPVVRVGHLASIQNEPIYTQYCGYTDAYLMEANSIAGMSGSPVFAVRGHVLDVDARHDMTKLHAARYLLLGMVHGHFDVRNLNEDVAHDGVEPLSAGVNTGMGVVIPIEKVIETLAHPNLAEARKEFSDMRRQKQGAKADLAAESAEPAKGRQANDANPNHLEDFTRLVGAAARTPPQED